MYTRKLLALLLATVASFIAQAGEAPQLTGLTNYTAPKFPIGLRGIMAGDAEVVMALTVGSDGHVMDVIALEASRAEFARAATEAVSQWQFSPTAAGKLLPRRELVQFSFRRNGVVTTLQHAEAAREGFISTVHAEIRTVQSSALDKQPERIAMAVPKVTQSQLNKLGNTPLLINFVIDSEGKVRVPVVTADDPALAQAVLDAVTKWRYAPPLQKGQPVLVEVTRSLVLPGK